jgi:prefoldin subunit 5
MAMVNGKPVAQWDGKADVAEERKPYGDYPQSPRAFGAGNFQRIVRANMGNLPSVTLEFPKPKDNINLDKKGVELISDYYDSLENDSLKNHFIYRVLPSADEVLTVLKKIGWNNAVQPDLPGIPTQGELPLQEKKKSNNDDLEAGDVKVARELQKLRARYPAVRSDIEAVASAEIDSAERSQQQLAAIRGANEKQDALLKQLVDLDKQQGREIDGLDQENNSLEQRLAQVQATNDRLQQAIGQMTGTKKAATKTKTTVPQGSTDVFQGGIMV